MVDMMTDARDRIARHLSSLPDAELKAMVVRVSAPILAELRRRGCEFSIGTDGIDGTHHPNASAHEATAEGILGNIVRISDNG